MSRTPDGRQIFTCPDCHGKGQVTVKRASKKGQQNDTVDCKTCDGSGQIVGPPE